MYKDVVTRFSVPQLDDQSIDLTFTLTELLTEILLASLEVFSVLLLTLTRGKAVMFEVSIAILL